MSGACAVGRCCPSLWADRRSNHVTAIGCSDCFKFLGRTVADGLDTSLNPFGVRRTIMRPGSLEILRHLWGTPLGRAVRIESGESYRDTFTVSTLVPRAARSSCQACCWTRHYVSHASCISSAVLRFPCATERLSCGTSVRHF